MKERINMINRNDFLYKCIGTFILTYCLRVFFGNKVVSPFEIIIIWLETPPIVGLCLLLGNLLKRIFKRERVKKDGKN